MLRALKAVGVAYVVATITTIVLARATAGGGDGRSAPLTGGPTGAPLTEAGRWFAAARPDCTDARAERWVTETPPPKNDEGSALAAACFAMAGKSERARELFEAIPASGKGKAVAAIIGVLPADLDERDDAIVPLMELVLDYAPDEPTALLRAGLAEAAAGDKEQATRHLDRFMAVHKAEDTARAKANATLSRIAPR